MEQSISRYTTQTQARRHGLTPPAGVLWGWVLIVSPEGQRSHVVGKLCIERPATNKSGLKPESRFTAAELCSTPKILAKAFRCRKTSRGCKGYITPCDWENLRQQSVIHAVYSVITAPQTRSMLWICSTDTG